LDGVSAWNMGAPYGFQIFLGDGQGGKPVDVSAQKSPPGGYDYFQQLRMSWTDGSCLVDINRDGWLDYVAARGGTSQTPSQHYSGVFINDKTGALVQAHGVLPFHIEYHEQVVAFDANGDRWPDLLFLSYLGLGENRLYLSTRAATLFVDASQGLPKVDPVSVSRILAVDVDADGDNDLVLARGPSYSPQPNFLWINDGKGAFAQTSGAWPSISEATIDVEIGDIDSDGDPDIVFCNGWKGGVNINDFAHQVYVNDGLGGFTARELAPKDPAWDRPDGPLWLADFDQDGSLDVLVGQHWSPSRRRARPTLYLNDGKGVFVDVTDSLWTNLPSATVSVGDGDSDGDPDIVSGQFIPPTLYYHTWVNMSRQLHVPKLPELGKTCDIEIYSRQAGSVAVPLLSFAERRTPMGIWGDLFLDPAGLVIGAPVSFASTHKQVLQVPIPSNPALRGMMLVWQAWVVDPSQPERARFTGKFADRIQ
jgi:hypothetical protein